MISTTGTTKTRRFQEQLIPAYLNSGLDFSYELSLLSPSEDVIFGVQSSNGSGRAQYKLKSGIVYDYNNRFVSTYRGGELKINYGLKSGLIFGDSAPSFFAYEEINDRPISYEDRFSGYQNNPFDRFYITNNGTSDFEFDLKINGFAPPTIYSNLVGIGSDIFSGNISQSGLSDYPTQGVKYGMFDIAVPSGRGQVTSFQTSGSGGLFYLVSGNSLFNGQTVDVEFDTHFGKFTVPITATTGSSVVGGSETGISISVHGDTNILQPLGSLIFEIDYYSNFSNDVLVELTSSGSFSTHLLSGSGAGFLEYEGFVRKSGEIYSSQYITGIADLESDDNTAFNTDYLLVDRYIDIQKRVESRKTGTFFIGQSEFTKTGVSLVGVYTGPYEPFIGYTFSGLGDITFTQDYEEIYEGVAYVIDEKPGYLNAAYSDFFYISPDLASIGQGVAQDATNSTIFPTGVAYGIIDGLYTGEGIMTTRVAYESFFGEGTGRIYEGRVPIVGTGPGEITFSGNCYEWLGYEDRGASFAYPPSPLPDFPAFADDRDGGAYTPYMEPVRAKGTLTNGAQTFEGTGVPEPYELTWGYPTGPSQISVPQTNLIFWADLNLPLVEGLYLDVGGSAPTFIPTGFGYTGRVKGYVQYGGGLFEGPIFPSPENTGLFPYYGDNNTLKVSGNAFYGRGTIFSSGGSQDGVNQFGIYVEDPTMLATFDIVSGDYQAAYVTGVSKAFLEEAYIRPAVYGIDDNGDEIIDGQNRICTIFPDPDFEKVETGFINGIGYVPVSELNLKFDFNYTQAVDEQGVPEFPVSTYSGNGWFTPSKYVKLDAGNEIPYVYPSGYQKAYAKVISKSSDLESFEEVSLRVSANGVTGDVSVFTNVAF